MADAPAHLEGGLPTSTQQSTSKAEPTPDTTAAQAPTPSTPTISTSLTSPRRGHHHEPVGKESSSPNSHARSPLLPPRSPRLHRSPSAMSVDARSSPTPSLHRKASMNSIHGVTGVTPNRSTPSRRASAQHQSLAAPDEDGATVMADAKSKHTAASIARAHFEAELARHAEDARAPTDRIETVAIIHDACYGHRYSRPRTSRAMLSTIVERPERIQAGLLGLSAAYVRLGERHVEGAYAPHPKLDASRLPSDSVPFRIAKSTRRMALSAPAVTNVHGVKWMEELRIMCENAEARLAMNGKELTRPDMARDATDADAPTKFHEGDLYLCAESLEAMEGAMGAVCDAVDTIFEDGSSASGARRAFVTIRPPGHHCSANYPSGFCWVNNVHVGISHAALAHGLTHAAIIDFDLHHGDGSQAIAWEHNQRTQAAAKHAPAWKRTSIGYFSLHDINSYPCEMGDEEKVKNASLCIENAHGQNIWNVHLQPWKTEREFWQLYESKYCVLLEKTRNFLRSQFERFSTGTGLPKPKAAIFLSAGFDASEWESPGMQRHKVNVPTEFYARLTRDVVALAAEVGTGVEGRIISVLEGGYSDRALCSGVFSHLAGLAASTAQAGMKEPAYGLGVEMGQRLGEFDLKDECAGTSAAMGSCPYDASWWSIANLEELDAVVKPAVAADVKKPRDPLLNLYSSPTTSSMAKVQSPRIQRSVSGHSSGSVSRASTPPPPDVPWSVAAHELSKLLIPSHRQIDSCRPEDLSAEATRVRKNRQSEINGLAVVTTPEAAEISGRMALRVRKPAKEPASDPASKKVATKSSRRKTVAGVASGADSADTGASLDHGPGSQPGYTQPTKQSSRRMSTASNASSTLSDPSSSRQVVASQTVGTIVPRAPSLSTKRPESSLSVTNLKVPMVVVKKTRPAPVRATTSENAKPIRTKRSSVPSGGVSSADRAGPGTLTEVCTPPATEPLPRPVAQSVPPKSTSSTANIDDITSGMRKVKISLTTKYQKEQAERQAAIAAGPPVSDKFVRPKKPTTAAARKPRALAKDKDNDRVVKAPEQAGEDVLAGGAGANAVQAPLSKAGGEDADEFSRPPNEKTSTPAMPRPQVSHAEAQTPQQITSSVAHNTHAFIPYEPNGAPPESIDTTMHDPPPGHEEQHRTLTWLPPNVTETPAVLAASSRAPPVWTSTGPIPFNVGNAAETRQGHAPPVPVRVKEHRGEAATVEHGKEQSEGLQEGSIWDVPVTPRTQGR